MLDVLTTLSTESKSYIEDVTPGHLNVIQSQKHYLSTHIQFTSLFA